MHGIPWEGEIEEISWVDWRGWGWEQEGAGVGGQRGSTGRDDWKRGTFREEVET